MERRLKERLVGAALLVIVIVLVVPELLSGPKQSVKTVTLSSVPTVVSLPAGSTRTEPMRTVTVDLDTQKTMALEAPPEPPVAANPPQPATTTAPGAAAPLPTAPVRDAAARDAAARDADAPAPPPTIENPAAPPKSWAVQLGSFANHANAEQLVRDVKAHNSPAYVSTSGAGQSLRYRVRVGPLADRAAAERMLAKLKSEGHAASVLAP